MHARAIPPVAPLVTSAGARSGAAARAGGYRHTVARCAPIAVCAVLAASGCQDLGAYATGPDEVYRGVVAGVEDPPVLRRGFAAATVLDMTFDPRRATDLDPPPGTLTTSDGSLVAVPLEPIAPLSHDVLGEYEIPSGERLRNYIFVLRPSAGPLAGREPMAFVSLMGDGTLEVRVIAGGGSAPGDYFGLFRLTRQAR